MIAMDMIQTAFDAVTASVQETIADSGQEYIGVFHVTAYAYTGSKTASGVYPTEKRTVACNSMPLGTEIYIEDMGRYIVEDRGAGWHSDNWLDIYMGDVESCRQWGNQEREVYVIKR